MTDTHLRQTLTESLWCICICLSVSLIKFQATQIYYSKLKQFFLKDNIFEKPQTPRGKIMRENPPSPLLQWSFWKCEFGWVCSWNCSAWLPNGPGLSHQKILVNGGKGVNWQCFQFLVPENCIYKIPYFQIFPKIFPRGVWIRNLFFEKSMFTKSFFRHLIHAKSTWFLSKWVVYMIF